MGVGLRGRYVARRALGGARLPLELRGLLGFQVEGVNVKVHGGHVHVSWWCGGAGQNRKNRRGREERGGVDRRKEREMHPERSMEGKKQREMSSECDSNLNNSDKSVEKKHSQRCGGART